MDFWGAEHISYDNIRIERIGTWEEYKETRDRISRERNHYQTGLLIIETPGDVTTIDQAREYCLKLITKLQLLLPFSHGHDVPIHELIFYEVSAGQEVWKGHEISAIWTGKPGAYSFNILPMGLNQFLSTAMPLLSDDEFVSRTSIIEALTHYNLAMNIGFLEIKFAILWLGLEAMANSFYENNQEDLILTRDEWNELKNRCRQYLTEIGKEEVYSNLLEKISFLRKGTIKERIDHMLRGRNYQMQQYSSEVAYMYDHMRVPFFHGGHIDWNANGEKVYRLKRLMEKMILKTLNFYDNNMVHDAIKDNDLSKR
jgi:hypothetical protein